MELEFLKKTQEADSIWSFYFRKPAALHFTAGDYVDVELQTSSELGARRWLTISSGPHQKYVRFTLKFTPEPSEFKQALMNLKPEQTAQISPPIGTFHLPRNKDTKVVWIAGGIGITPFVSKAEWLTNYKQSRAIELLYVAKQDEHIFLDKLTTITSLTKTTERPQNLEQHIHKLKTKQVFLSGPQNFCEYYYNQLLQSGLARNQLHLDYFPGYTDI